MQCDTYEPKHLIILYIHINTHKHKNLSVVNIWNSSNKLVIYGEVSKANNQWAEWHYNTTNRITHLTLFDRFTVRTNMQIQYLYNIYI